MSAATSGAGVATLCPFMDLAIGARFSYKSHGDVYVLLERHGLGLVAQHAPSGVSDPFQGIYSAFGAESECRSAEVLVYSDAAPTNPSAGPLGGWLPIATAPKDGTRIMLGRAEDADADRGAISTPGRWHEEDHDGPDNMGHDAGFMDDDFQEFSCGRSFGAESYRSSAFQPTYWQPLPSAPGAEVAPAPDLTGAQFAVAQHLHTVQVQADALAGLQAKCDLLSASLKQADGVRDQLVAAIQGVIRVADRATDEFDAARAALRAAGELS